MNSFKIVALILFTLIIKYSANAQIVTLYKEYSQRIILESKANLATQLCYYNVGPDENNLIEAPCFAISRNLKKDSSGQKCLQIPLYQLGRYKDGVMTINIYFKAIPDTITYYLNIPFFKTGVRTVYIEGGPKPVIKLPLDKYIERANIHDPIYSITEIVFPDKE